MLVHNVEGQIVKITGFDGDVNQLGVDILFNLREQFSDFEEEMYMFDGIECVGDVDFVKEVDVNIYIDEVIEYVRDNCGF